MNFRILLFAFIFLGSRWALSQISYLDRPDMMRRVDSCLQHTYNFSFSSAKRFQQELARLTPDHPAPPFLEALIIYWEYFPLTPQKRESERFIQLMDRSVELSERYIPRDHTHLEGVFFDLFGRAFKAMFWADNGKAIKVAPDLPSMYRHTKEGFEMKEAFSEFYFSTGLYNYYIEAYPEAHPVYKPMLAFMQGGDKEKGLAQLSYAIHNTIYLKVEALLFMSLIQLNYERDLNTAALYAERLFREYPRNIYYQGHLVTIMLYQHRYRQVRVIMETMKEQQDPYSKMISAMATAYMSEKELDIQEVAEKAYRETIELARSIGPFADKFQAIAYMGLSRLYAQKGSERESRSHAKTASGLTSYPFILEE